MSAAAVEHAIILPEIRPRSWGTLATIGIDVLALEFALLLACLVRVAMHSVFPIALGSSQYSGLALGVLSLPVVYLWIGLYPGYGMGPVARLRARVYATLAVFGLLLTWNYVFQDQQWSRGVLLITAAFGLIIPPAVEALMRKYLIANGICGLPVVILGAGETGSLVAQQLMKQKELGFVPVGILDDNSRKWGSEIHGVPVLGPLSLARRLEGKAKALIVAMPGLRREKLCELVETLSFPNIIIVPDLFGMQSLWITSRDLGGVLGLEVRKNLFVPANRLLKRTLDYAISLPLAILTLPLLTMFAAWIKIASAGSPFFQQEREGKDGKKINIFKLRTMHPDADRLLREYLESHPEEERNWVRYYKLKNDPRVIPGIGWFLRRYSLDELPQLWNVLRGDMSLVGPRPFPVYHLASFPQRFRSMRSSVMPGLTGLWQVSDRSDGDVSVQEQEDTYYIRNWSLWLDIFILIRTVQSVLFPRGAY
jgi:Undecaprenyl-phosphate galactose phosphotransferase WbaP